MSSNPPRNPKDGPEEKELPQSSPLSNHAVSSKPFPSVEFTEFLSMESNIITNNANTNHSTNANTNHATTTPKVADASQTSPSLLRKPLQTAASRRTPLRQRQSSARSTANASATPAVGTASPSLTNTIEEVLYPGKLVADFWQWPVFFAILPPILTLYYGGKVEEWSEGFLLVVVAFYLYGLIKLPWELYVSAKLQASQWNRVSLAYRNSSLDPQHPAEQQRQSSARHLWFLERFYFALVFASPLGGAVFLRYIRPHLHVYRSTVNEFPMALYVLTAYIRPLIHLSRLLKHGTAHLKEEVMHDEVEMDRMRYRVRDLEVRIEELALLYEKSRDETDRKLQQTLEESVQPQLKGFDKNMRKTVRKEQRFMDYSAERFQELEERLAEQEHWIQNHHAYLDGTHWQQRQRPLLKTAYWLLDSVPSVSTVVWFPVRVAVRFTTWWIPKALLPAPLAARTSPAKRTADGSLWNGAVFGTRRASIMMASRNTPSPTSMPTTYPTASQPPPSAPLAASAGASSAMGATTTTPTIVRDVPTSKKKLPPGVNSGSPIVLGISPISAAAAATGNGDERVTHPLATVP